MTSIFVPLIISFLSFILYYWVGEQIIEFRRLKKHIHEKIIDYGNVWKISTGIPPEEAIIIAQRNETLRLDMRKLSAETTALNQSLTCISKFFIVTIAKYDLELTASSLMQYYNDSDFDNKIRDTNRKNIEKSLRLTKSNIYNLI